MLPKSASFIFLLLLVNFSCQQEISSKVLEDIMNDDDDVFFKHTWSNLQPQLSSGLRNWFSALHDQDLNPAESSHQFEKSATNTEKDREPLSPDFKDPKGDVEKPPSSVTFESVPKKPDTDFGIIDIPAGANNNGGSIFGSGGHGVVLKDLPGFGRWPGNIFDMFGGIPTRTPWWKGPNVCTEKEEIIESEDKETDTDSIGFFGSINFSSCSQTLTKYECTTKTSTPEGVKTLVIKYKCCHGYKLGDQNQCEQVEDLKTVAETCTKLSGKEFSTMMINTGIDRTIENENVTVFLPTDEALKEFSEKLLEMNEVEMYVNGERQRRDASQHALSSRELVQSHIVPGLVELNDLSNGDVIHSQFDNSTIRINMYPTSSREILTTANCIKVFKKDQMASNGIIHVLDGVMTPVTKSLNQILANNDKLRTFSQIMEKINLNKLFEEDKVYTIFAPSDAAFEKLSPEVFEKLKKGSSCAENILKHHILSHSVCSNAITFNATTHNMDGTPISMKRDASKNLIIENKAQVIDSDIMATNGIVHIIDTLLMPDSGLDASQLLLKHNLTEFESLVKESGLLNEIDNRNNITLIAPSNEAIKRAAPQLEQIKNDPEKLRDLIRYHVVQNEIKTCDFQNNDMLDTDLGDQQLRVNLYNTLPFFNSVYNKATINCARVTTADEQACGSVIQEVNQVLIPPKDSLLETIQKSELFTTFAELLNGTKLEEELNESNSSFTILVPTDDAFERLPAKVLATYKNNPEKADELLRLHVIPDILCCSGVGYQSFPFTKTVKTLSPYTLTQGHDGQNRVRFADASTTQCDQIATNGIIHSVNKVIIPAPRRSSSNPFEHLNFMFLNF